MQFQRLRLAGFKSFVDATELRIEPGLTGVVGPNGCGKSNLLEALRWVMGANSAKAMRGSGMDDVIFAGAEGRPGRNHAEVTLTIDNTAGLAPAPFRDQPVLEVVRRIDRGAGSTYRVNGREVLARQVQLLFADASTGANSPALVRQGQISELIAARPQNRRLVLEEAAGVAGLHGRRHEAELKVRATQSNLERLEDIAGELEAQLARLRREARQAERYRRLSAEIRQLQSALLHARWLEARSAFLEVEAEAQDAEAEVERRARAAAAANAAALEAEAAIRPLRDEETASAAVAHRLEIEADRIEREQEGAAAEVVRLTAELARQAADAGREGQIVEDAGRALTRLETEIAALEADAAGAPEREPELAAAHEAAAERRRASDLEVERLAAASAAADAARRAAEARMEETQARLARTRRALEQARSEHRALAPGDGALLEAARVAAERADAALGEARTGLESAEAARAQALEAEREARTSARTAADRLAAATAEARGLRALTADRNAGATGAAMDAVTPEKGYEAALAAALGDDLAASLDPGAPAFWAGAEAPKEAWPPGVEPLGPYVRVPAELAARLAYVGLVAPDDGAKLAARLRPGQRLVSAAGDLWRWDGLTVKATAPRPAEARLRQRARLAELERQIADLTAPAQAAAAAARAVTARLAERDAALARARQTPRQAENDAREARQKLDILAREETRRDARAASLAETVGRFEAEEAEHAAQLELARRQLMAAPPDAEGESLLAAGREAARAARADEAAARAALEVERREREGRRRRLEALIGDRDDWVRRARSASLRQDQLAADREATQALLDRARDAPIRLEMRRQALLGELSMAAARRARSADSLTVGEAARADAERAWRAAESAAGAARERRASLAERLGGARDRFAAAAADIRGRLSEEPDALGRRLTELAPAVTQSAVQMEARMTALEREREQLGPVNLGADASAEELAARLEVIRAERSDLAGALAKLRQGIAELNAAGRERLLAAFSVIDAHFRALFTTLFEGGQAELRLVEAEDPLEAGLEIYVCPPGKRLTVMSLLSGGEQALTAAALIFAVFLANPAPICVLDEVDAPLDDANVDRFCNMLDEMRRRAPTRFIAITHNPLTMSRMDRLYGVTMHERGVSRLVSVDLRQAEALAAE